MFTCTACIGYQCKRLLVLLEHVFQMKELRNHGDEVAREIASRGSNGSLSQQRYFEDFMRLVRTTTEMFASLTLSFFHSFLPSLPPPSPSLSPFHSFASPPLPPQIGDLYRSDPYDLSLEFWSSGEAGPRGIPPRYTYTYCCTCKCTCTCTACTCTCWY